MTNHWTGRQHTAATKLKMRLAKLGRGLSPAHRLKIGLAHRGRKLPASWRQNISDGQIQFRISSATLKRLYLVERRSGAEIAKQVGCERHVIYNRLRRFRIPRRNPSDAKIGRTYPKAKAAAILAGISRRATRHWNWKGGISYGPYGVGFRRSFKESIKRRDGLRCVECHRGRPETRLEAHHIDFSVTNHDPRNLITLCTACHNKTKQWERTKNYAKRDYWVAHFQHRIATLYPVTG